MRNELMTDELYKWLEKELAEVRFCYDTLLVEKNQLLAKVLVTGLTTEELQGIHGLILKQIDLISNAQESASKNALSSGVSDLLKLASLVSKPTD